MSNSIVDILKKTSAFHGVPDDVLGDVASKAGKKYYNKNQTIFEIGSPSDGVYIIVAGRVGISSLFADGKEIVLNILERNEIFGEVGAVDGLPRTASAIAMGSTVALYLDGNTFRNLVYVHPVLCYGIMSVLCSRVRWTSSLIEDTVFRDTRTRLAKRLLMLADVYGAETEEGTKINIKMSQDHLGRMLGVSRESISKEGGFLKDNQAVSFRHGVIVIHDREYLEKLAALS